MKFTQKYQNNYSLKNTLWAIHAPEATSDQCHTTSACVSKNLKISLSLTCCTFFRETYRFESYFHGYLELKIRFINILDMKSSNKEFFYKYKQIIWGDSAMFTFPWEQPLREKCPYSELFWSVFSRIWNEYGEIFRISPSSVRMRETADQNNSEYRLFFT